VKVKVLGFDDRGKIKLSMKFIDQQTGAELSREEQSRSQPETTF
jgi:polyribonucleotide nucleotidyltransferase